jgi:SHS2 domain-containing protein
MTTDIEKVEKLYSMDFTATGSDLTNVVFSLLESCLYNFSTEPFFIGRASRILTLKRDTGEISIDIRVWGESFDKAKHPSGTEVKAITYSNLQVNENRKIDDFSDKRRTDIYVIVDI